MGSWHEQLHDRIERADGPAVIAYWDQGEAASEQRGETRTHDWHRHLRGQIYCIESGLVHARTRYGSWLLPPHRAGWMPPGELHTVSVSGPMSGWGVFLTPEACAGLPDRPCVIGSSELLRALVRRASSWAFAERLEPEQERVCGVLLDELRRAPQEPLHLPMPIDRRLLRIAHAVLQAPQDNRSLESWAERAGLSVRSLSRLFRHETALSFAQWRQQARLGRALERLAEGMPVAQVAEAAGYGSTSAFIAMFRRAYGQSPARYFERAAAVAA
ncbi:helix-turn-helix transcriptional regulator [Rhodanobacter sp. DHG33]|uniref:AraC family transcriptional regulator n=1 Tax=Rhodanobacter sp. DHG33 TaxID=2775921 RepID=UPI001780BFB5|nr:helix-turn-helix transcriptional regulator [Rhodanobacter sp. DHG33]MBD8898636.1 helix-turn-helix transcriptional regulator [Rhodanobacter sp. DHG33]